MLACSGEHGRRSGLPLREGQLACCVLALHAEDEQHKWEECADWFVDHLRVKEKMGPKRSRRGPGCGHDGARWRQELAKMEQEGAKVGQDRAKVGCS